MCGFDSRHPLHRETPCNTSELDATLQVEAATLRALHVQLAVSARGRCSPSSGSGVTFFAGSTESVRSDEPAASTQRAVAGVLLMACASRRRCIRDRARRGPSAASPSHLAQVGRSCRHPRYQRDGVRPLVGQEFAGRHHREGAAGRLCLLEAGIREDVRHSSTVSSRMPGPTCPM